MQLSYSVIKEDFAAPAEAKKVSTTFKKKFKPCNNVVNEIEATPEDVVVNYEELIRNYENIASNILKNARLQAERIKVESLEKANILEKETYEKAYAEGKRNGYEDGKNDAFSEFIPQAKQQSEETIIMADSILKYAKAQYEDYLSTKKGEILELSYVIAEHILRCEISENEGVSRLVEQALEDSKGGDNVIIKCNPIHEEEISNKLHLWKTNYSIKGEIFILPNPSIPEGNIVIEKDSGVMEVGIDVALNIIKEEMFS